MATNKKGLIRTALVAVMVGTFAGIQIPPILDIISRIKITVESEVGVIGSSKVKSKSSKFENLLDLIGKTEGTDKGRGYNETLSYGAFTGGDVDLVRMTLRQIDELQTRMLRHPRNKYNSSAVGRYQIIRTTLRSLKKIMKLSNNELLTAELQDRMAITLIKGRGYEKWVRGEMLDHTFMNNIAKEWASLPKASGGSHYKGQRAALGPQKVAKILGALKG